jgi:predicted nucleic acid-binding protein
MTAFPVSLRRRRAFVDSSANLALFNQDDRNHALAVATLDWLIDQRYRLYTTNAMLIESHALILSVLGSRVANRFLRDVTQSNTVVVRVLGSDEARVRQILFRYDDKVFSYNDAISFAVMERLNIGLAFTFDSDFRQYGWSVAAPPSGMPGR